MKTIELTRGRSCVVDDEDYEKYGHLKWYASRTGYAQRHVPGTNKFQILHRLIVNAPEGMEVDHINGKEFDNRKSNLRIVTGQQNKWNRKKHRNTNGKLKGVYKYTNSKWYRATITVSGKSIHLGCFKNAIDGHRAYVRAARRFFGEYARGA